MYRSGRLHKGTPPEDAQHRSEQTTAEAYALGWKSEFQMTER
jgi:hypothetical protein